jgi:hypothetical protein
VRSEKCQKRKWKAQFDQRQNSSAVDRDVSCLEPCLGLAGWLSRALQRRCGEIGRAGYPGGRRAAARRSRRLRASEKNTVGNRGSTPKASGIPDLMSCRTTSSGTKEENDFSDVRSSEAADSSLAISRILDGRDAGTSNCRLSMASNCCDTNRSSLNSSAPHIAPSRGGRMRCQQDQGSGNDQPTQESKP